MGSLTVNLCGIELDNPVIPASGTFGYGYEYAELFDINQLGTFSSASEVAEFVYQCAHSSQPWSSPPSVHNLFPLYTV